MSASDVVVLEFQGSHHWLDQGQGSGISSRFCVEQIADYFMYRTKVQLPLATLVGPSFAAKCSCWADGGQVIVVVQYGL